MTMHRSPVLGGALAAASVFFLSQLATAEPAPPTRAITIDDLATLQKVSGAQLDLATRSVYFAAARARPELNRWQSALFVQRLDAAGRPSGPATRLTHPERGTKQEGQDMAPALSPDGQWLAFLSTRDGGAAQVYILSPAGGEARRLTQLLDGAAAITWGPDSRTLIVQSRVYADCPAAPAVGSEECQKRRTDAREASPMQVRMMDRLFYRHWDSWNDGRRSHLFRLQVPRPGEAVAPLVDLTPGDHDAPPLARAGAQPFSLSPDGRELAYVQNRDKDLATSTNNDIFLQPLDAQGRPQGAARNLTASNLATDATPRYSPDGRYIAYLAQRRPGFEADRFEVVLLDRQSGQSRSLTAGFDSTIGELAWSPDSQRLFFTTSLLGRGAIYSCDLSGRTPPTPVSSGDSHDIQLVRAATGSVLFFLRSTLSRPAEAYALPLDAAGRPLTSDAQPLTAQNAPALSTLRMGQASQLQARSQDGLPLQAHLVTPPDFNPAHRYPAVVLIHGGPQGAWEDFWQWRWNAQLFAGAGYVVLMPNPRGSEGFGQQFVDGVSGDWGGRAYDDIMRLVDQLVAQPYVDSKRVAALGASYGGYMVNWIGTQTDRFAALVSHAGVFDLRSMYGETEEVWFPRWEFHGDPWTSDQYDRFSPSRYADRYKTPMLVISNEHDFRVPVGQGMQLFTALQVRHVPSRLVIFPEENHWVLRPSNARFWYGVVFDWLHRYIGGAAVDPKILEQAATHTR